MRRASLLSGFVATSLLIALPTTAPGQGSPDLDKGYGVGHASSPTGRAETRRQEAITPRGWTNDPQEKPWFLEDSVRKELGFEEQQLGPLYENYALVWQRYKENQAKLEAGKTDEERALEEQADFARELRSNYNRDMQQYANEYMTEAQRLRYQQLHSQYQGINAFSNPDYVEYFGFDDRQLGYIDRLQNNYNRRMGDLSRFDGDPRQRRRAFDDLRRQTAADLDRILTDRQRQQLQQMQGNPFEFTDNDYLRTADDIDTGGQQSANPTAPSTGTPNSPNPGSGIGLPQNSGQGSGVGLPGSGQGSGVGVPQPTAPNTGTGGPGSGGPGGTAGDLDGGGGTGGASGGGASGGSGGSGSGGGSGS